MYPTRYVAVLFPSTSLNMKLLSPDHFYSRVESKWDRERQTPSSSRSLVQVPPTSPLNPQAMEAVAEIVYFGLCIIVFLFFVLPATAGLLLEIALDLIDDIVLLGLWLDAHKLGCLLEHRYSQAGQLCRTQINER